uniref:Thioredoxin domain containing 9 n=1 Tax=Neolamprologus brichardi TaxID=32507 RepID=A0A3Q4G7Y4_NEOBR
MEVRTKVLEQSAKLVEEQVDAQLAKLNEMDEDDLERLKERRLEALKKAQKQKQEWLSKGHGEYRDISSEKDFFSEVKDSKNVVCHFYRNSTFSGNLREPPTATQRSGTKFTKVEKKTIRGRGYDSDSEDD